MEEEILLTIDIAIRLIYMKTASENSYTEIESMFKGIKDAIGDENWKVEAIDNHMNIVKQMKKSFK